MGVTIMYAQKTTLKKNTLFEKSQQTGLDYVLRLNTDRLLSPVYSALGKSPKAPTYGGWESQQIQGHSLGHYLSALSGFVYQTDSKEAKEKLDYTVACLKSIQRKDGYLGGIPSTPFDTAFSGNFNVDRFGLASWWVPWYSVHKIYAGLIEAYLYGGNKDALEIVIKMADWAIKASSKMTDEQFQKMLYCEHGGMCKVYADLYGITGDKKYLTMAERFIDHEIIDPLMEEKDELQGHHANTQIPKIIGLARLYELTGKEEYKRAVEFFFNTVTQTRSYVIGGNSDGEHFGPQYAEPLSRATCETCNSYNMLELAEHIFSWQKDSLIADFYERTLYNHILASQDPESGAKTYFVSTHPGFFKVYGSFENAFWCCTGTGMENPERYNRFIASDLDDCLYLNLFIPSTIKTDDGWQLELNTNFPYEEKASLKVIKKGKNSKALKVRVPYWLDENKKGDGYRLLSESIKEGDNFEIDLNEKINIRKTRDKSGNFSILYGPIVLAADLGKAGMPADTVDNQTVYMNSPAKKVAPITGDILKAAEWVKLKDAESLTFTTDSKASADGKEYILKPFYDIHHTRYTIYFNAENQKEDERTVKFSSISVDSVEAGRQQSEVDHRSKASGTEMGYIQNVDRAYRSINEKGGSFSYKMKFDTTKKNTLVITVYGNDEGSICVSLNGHNIGKISNDGSKGECLVDYELSVPEEIVAEKRKGSSKTTKLELAFESDKETSLKILEVHVTH